jgi:hypothetical protein
MSSRCVEDAMSYKMSSQQASGLPPTTTTDTGQAGDSVVAEEARPPPENAPTISREHAPG